MKRNRKRKSILHSAARTTNRADDATTAKIVLGVIVAVVAVGLAIGATVGVRDLHKMWLEQCVLTNVASQVRVETGSHVKRNVILEGFGLKEGANLAEIDFAEKRELLMQKVPNIRSLTVTRHLPDGVDISVVEREPVAKMEIKGAKNPSGLVVDSEGVVFRRRGGATDLLPKIIEPRQPGTLPGKALTGKGRAALDMLMLCADEAFAGFSIIAVDLSQKDYLLAVLGNYQRAKIAWEGMDEPDSASRANMEDCLSKLRHAVLSGVATRAKIWNATQPGHITADTKEPIP